MLMFRTLANKMLLLLYFVIGALILEAFTFAILDFGFMPEYFWYNFFLIIAVGASIFIVPNYTAQYVVYTVLLVIQAVLIYINYSLTRVYGDLLSLEMIRLIREAGAAMTSSFVYIAVLLELVLIMVFIATIGALILKYCKKDKNTIKQHFSVFIILFFITVQLTAVGFSVQTRESVGAHVSITNPYYALTDRFLMDTPFLKTSSYIKFGTYGYYTNMLANSIKNEQKAIQKATIEYFDAGHIYGETDETTRNELKETTDLYELFGIDQGNNVIVIMMESIEWFGFGDGTYDPTLNNIKYVDNQLTNKTLTPNITKLIYGEDYLEDYENSNTQNDALMATNFFAKSKTNMSEGQGIAGNYPIGQTLHDIVKDDTASSKALGYSLPNVLNEKGYTTTYVHSHKSSFYNRINTHKSLGFDNVIGKEHVLDENGDKIYTGDELDFDNWDAEGNFAKNAINYIVPEDRTKPFFTFYLNVSSHGSYTPDRNEQDGDVLKYFDYVRYGEDDCTFNETTGCWELNKKEDEATPTLWYQNVLNHKNDVAERMAYYQCGVVGLDDAIGEIINKLKAEGIYDKTTLLLYSDHYAYYDDLTHDFKEKSIENNYDQELNTIPMLISSPGIRKYRQDNPTNANQFLSTNRFTSAYDVVPTILDLLGFTFNENFYLGQSIFKPVDNIYRDEYGNTKEMTIYYSNTGGIFGDGVYTFDLQKFTKRQGYTDIALELFKNEAAKHLVKINFITCLNRYRLYEKVSTK